MSPEAALIWGQSHTDAHTHPHTHSHRRTHRGGLEVSACGDVCYSTAFSHYVIALRRLFLKLVSEEGDTVHPLSSKNSSGSLVRDCAAPSPPLFSPQPSHSVDGHPRSVRSSCPPVMPRSRVDGSACCLGIRCGAWTPSWERASPSTAAETSPRCPCSPGRSSRWEPPCPPDCLYCHHQNKVWRSAWGMKDGRKGSRINISRNFLLREIM